MTIVITAKRDGFRRCGIPHPSKPTSYPDDFFTEEQLDALHEEPQLILAYTRHEVDLVKDPLNDALSQVFAPQTSNALSVTEPKVPETISTPMVASVVEFESSGAESNQSGPPKIGPELLNSNGEADSLTGPQSPSDSAGPPDPGAAQKPDKTRATKAKVENK